MADDREKPKEACSKGLSEILEEDRISQLPDHLIYHILGYLSINDVVRPSILSTRWRGLWLWVPRLELSSREFSDFNAFASFGDKFFDSDRVSCIENLELTIVVNENTSYFTSWIDDAVKRNVQHLRLDFCLTSYFERPVSLYVCHTLVSLKLNCMTLDVVEFFSFPRLKTMHLTYLWLSKDATFERFVSSCPVLEDLEIFGYLDASQPLRVHSRSLKRLIIAGCASTKVDSVPGIIIDAPLLCDLAIIDEKSKSFIVNNMEYNAKLKIDVSFGIEVVDEASVSSRRSLIRSCLSGILKVEDLTIFGDILLKIIHYYSKSESLPQFGYMSQLSLVGEYMKWFEPFLESCPNLKSLVLMVNLLNPMIFVSSL
ncbi:PREDICTED: putative FBD-associated F-box protein At5g53635 [Camelina sativa]|uniref:FBD-associated F-box protein At5g53635 n=1 Tax=Camelina sativa TaxID=90675 RepID=A0ABM1R9E0_CAMSA|nr:PREDICTED: putative FBD-associated F-box protein At5g53635 [Camelina sativa]